MQSLARNEIPDTDAAIKIAMDVLPFSACLLAMGFLPTSALMLMGAAGACVFISQPDLLSQEGKIRVVSASLSATVLYTALKVVASLATLAAGAALLDLTIGAAASVSIYAAYKWLTETPRAPETTPKTPEIKDPA
jgi:hypothetical protein